MQNGGEISITRLKTKTYNRNGLPELPRFRNIEPRESEAPPPWNSAFQAATDK
jgi:hypothetical protein